jgi:hypothetical protein
LTKILFLIERLVEEELEEELEGSMRLKLEQDLGR